MIIPVFVPPNNGFDVSPPANENPESEIAKLNE